MTLYNAVDHQLLFALLTKAAWSPAPPQTQKLGIKNAYTDPIQTRYKPNTNPSMVMVHGKYPLVYSLVAAH